MKKFIAFALLSLLMVSAVFSSVTETNRQEIVPVDSPIYRAMKTLYISEGLALPSTTGPWSMAEMDMMLSRINPEKLDSSEMEVYEYLQREITTPPRIEPAAAEGLFGFTISADVALEGYLHTNPDDFGDVDMWGDVAHVGDYNETTPLVSVPLETWFGNNIYGFSSFDLGVNRIMDNPPKLFYTNILMVPPSVLSDLDFNFPNRAFGSIGGSWWNFSIGRDKLRWGPGESGNLTVGGQIPYHNNARFTAFSKVFKYTFSISSFVHPMNYLNKDGNLDFDFWQDDTREGISMFIAHRLEWRILDKVNMALTESIMYQSASNQFDLLVLSPTAIFHNYYIRGNANSLLSFEADYTFLEHWNLYGEAVIDEFKMPGEFTNDGPPSAYGFILGVKTAYPLDGGMLYGSIEGAYTYPYLYLRQVNEETTGGDPKYGLNFIVDTPDVLGSGRTKYTLDYLGYRYGNDSVVGNLKVGYEKFGKWKAEFDFTYWADGTMDMYSKWARTTPGVDDPVAPTPEHDKGTSGTGGSWLPEGESNWESRNAVAHWFILTLSGEWNIIDRLNLYGQIRFLGVLNAGNIRGETATDFQISLGLSYSF